MNILRVIRYFIVLIPLLAACSPAAAPTTYTTVSEATLKPGSAIPAPTGDVVLTIDGKISQTNSGNTLQFDMPTLEKLGVVQYKVDDPFAKKTILYSGVLLSQLLKVAGASSDATMLTLRALDDYSTDMKISDANKWPVLLATQADGTYMPIDKNGPLISVWPFNDFPEIDHVTYDAQWLWSLSKITVK
ncbi:MAG: molybdopterin-dependent oxidoreductase [Chloroflexota bacterium]